MKYTNGHAVPVVFLKNFKLFKKFFIISFYTDIKVKNKRLKGRFGYVRNTY